MKYDRNTMNKLSITLLALTCIIASFAGAQPNRSPLRLEADYAAFRYDGENAYTEFYYSFLRGTLSYAKEGNGYRASVLMRALVYEQKENAAPFTRSWRVPIVVTDTASMAESAMVGKIEYVLAPDRYRVVIIAEDEAKASLSDTATLAFEVPAFSATKPQFSDIQLASSLQEIERDTANIFYKNTLEVIPNPARLYGKELPTLLYYVELYNPPSPQYTIKSELVNAYGRTVFERKKVKMQSSSHDAAQSRGTLEFGAIPIHTFSSNIYTFLLTLLDTTGKALTSQSRRVYLFNPSVAADSIQYARKEAEEVHPFFAGMAEDELDREFSYAAYISDHVEKATFKSLSGSEAKKKFLSKFWSKRDPDPNTARNEFMDMYHERVEIANRDYRSAYSAGWKTDLGRVYILYGKPDAVERFPSTSDSRPHQIWTYDNIESGVYFVFIDMQGFGAYQLVHSTKYNELRDDNWQRHVEILH